MRNRGLITSAWICAVISVALTVRLVDQRFTGGSGFPAFSSLRSDPLGGKVLFDAMEAMGRGPRRNYEPLESLRIKDAAILKIGIPAKRLETMETDEWGSLIRLARDANSVILALSAPCLNADLKLWGVKLKCEGKRQSLAGTRWTPLAEGSAIRRRFGTGEIVLLADARMLNNGSLLQARRSDLIAALLEGRSQIVFDEHHLGVTDQASTGMLIRRYRLHGVIAAALLLFLLFVWKNSSSFLPAPEEGPAEIAGRESSAGLANLLRRAIPSSGVVRACLTEWGKLPQNGERAEQLATVLASHRDPAAGYNAIARAISQKTRYPD